MNEESVQIILDGFVNDLYTPLEIVSRDYAVAQVYTKAYSKIQSLYTSIVYLRAASESRISDIESFKRKLSVQWGLTLKEEERLDAQITHEYDKLPIYRSQLLYLEEQLENGKERNRAAHYLLSQKQLPVELWRRIFLFAFISRFISNPTIPISQVCRFWRLVSLDYPYLWSYVPIGSNPSIYDSTRTAELIYRTGSIARPGSHPCLHVDIINPTGPICLDEYFMSIHPQTPPTTFQPAGWHHSSTRRLSMPRDIVIHREMRILHDIRHIHTLHISAAPQNTFSSLELALTEKWPLQTVKFTEVIPSRISIPTPTSITKISLCCTLWPEGYRLEGLLTNLAVNLAELELEDLGIPSHSLHTLTLGCDFPVLRVLRISLAGFTNNIDSMIMRHCPNLSCLGIYEVSTPLDRLDYMISVLLGKEAEELRRRLKTFEIHTYSSPESPPIFYSLKILHHMPAVRKLELTGPHAPNLLHQLSQMPIGSRVREVREVIIKSANLSGLDIVNAIGRETEEQSAKPLSGVRELTLDNCSGITRVQCDALKEVVDRLDIFC